MAASTITDHILMTAFTITDHILMAASTITDHILMTAFTITDHILMAAFTITDLNSDLKVSGLEPSGLTEHLINTGTSILLYEQVVSRCISN